MASEIEGKWLNPDMTGQVVVGSKRLTQGYIAKDPNSTVARIRQEGDEFVLAFKSKGHFEAQRPIERDFFDELWPLTEGRSLTKIRYIVELIGYQFTNLAHPPELRAEVDVFDGVLSGLVMVEVEVPTREHLEQLRSNPPGWFGQDVTDNPHYSNSWLAEHGLPI